MSDKEYLEQRLAEVNQEIAEIKKRHNDELSGFVSQRDALRYAIRQFHLKNCKFKKGDKVRIAKHHKPNIDARGTTGTVSDIWSTKSVQVKMDTWGTIGEISTDDLEAIE